MGMFYVKFRLWRDAKFNYGWSLFWKMTWSPSVLKFEPTSVDPNSELSTVTGVTVIYTLKRLAGSCDWQAVRSCSGDRVNTIIYTHGNGSVVESFRTSTILCWNLLRGLIFWLRILIWKWNVGSAPRLIRTEENNCNQYWSLSLFMVSSHQL